MRFTHQLRLAVRELGRRLAAEDKLGALDDVFYLTVEEALGPLADSRLRIKRRIAERERLQAVRLPAVIDTAWLPLAVPGAAHIADELCGTGLFPGVVEGTVRVVASADDAGLQSDDIAVITTADIESVTLLGTPAAVLTGGGTALADVARAAAEVGVPFVAGVADGAVRLCSGMRVRVDGSTGLVTVLALDCEVVGA
jgi:phosphohistidine swiveling domain-containing protein